MASSACCLASSARSRSRRILRDVARNRSAISVATRAYGSLAIGLVLLAADLGGRFRVPPTDFASWRRSASVGAAVVGVTPLLLLLGQTLPPGAGLGASWPLAAFVLGYLALALAFGVGLLGRAGDRSAQIRRAAYLGHLMIAVAPSSLLLLTPFITLAGLALARRASGSDAILS
jgi:hypothetical protein